MRTLVIGDIHGCAVALDTLLDFIAIQPEDHIITLGDYIDRGPDSKGVFDRLMQLEEECHYIPLKGNHEQLMELACQSRMDRLMWTQVGGLATLISFDVTAPSEIPQKYWDFIDRCSLVVDSEKHIFVHGGVESGQPLSSQLEEVLLWQRFDEIKPHQSGKMIFCGHTPDEEIQDKGYAVCVDTYVYADGWLTCMDVVTGEYWQANEYGETRSGQHVFKH